MQRRMLWALLFMLSIGLAVSPAWAGREDEGEAVVINSYGAPVFLYGGSSYVPIRSAANFLGAALLWDSVHNRATVTYNGRELGMVIGSRNAYYGGRQVLLPAPPVIVHEQVLVPVSALDTYLGAPVRWDEEEDRVLLRGPHGWGYYQVAPYPPVEVVAVFEKHGPPPWAPAHGRRRKQAVYVATPFVYSGVTYLPLRDVTSLIGAALLWDSLRGRALVTYNGREIGLVIGSPRVLYGGETLVLAASPILVRDVVYVPADFCERSLKLPVRHDRGILKVKGPRGWHDFRIASRPPGQIRRVAAGRAERGPGRVRSEEKGHGRAKAQERGRGRARSEEKGRGRQMGAAGRAREERGGKAKHEGAGQGRGKGQERGRGKH